MLLYNLKPAKLLAEAEKMYNSYSNLIDISLRNVGRKIFKNCKCKEKSDVDREKKSRDGGDAETVEWAFNLNGPTIAIIGKNITTSTSFKTFKNWVAMFC